MSKDLDRVSILGEALVTEDLQVIQSAHQIFDQMTEKELIDPPAAPPKAGFDVLVTKINGPSPGTSKESLWTDELDVPYGRPDAVGAIGAFVKNDTSKLRPGAMPPEALLEVVKVFTYGARKYPNDNYRKGTQFMRYHEALQRHMLQWWLGENNDGESGISHLAHIAASAMILLAMQLSGLGTDDRPKVKTAGWELPKEPPATKPFEVG